MKKTVKKSRTAASRRRKQQPAWQGVLNRARYLPAIVIAVFATYLSWQPQIQQVQRGGVLAYATNTSPSGLLAATNTQRNNNGASVLSSNSKLASAAQAKAQDMVARDYWSHVTPDGQQPWVFINNAGYSYTSAGENLAYGFLSSGDTVTGWMNSPSHKANLLSTAFTEVGFGIANSANFVGEGPQTIVVAMYGAPQVAGVATTAPSSSPTPVQKVTPAPAETAPAPTPEILITETAPVEKETIAVANTSDQPALVSQAGQRSVSRIQMITSGAAVWSASALVIAVLATGVLWTLHHGRQIRRFLRTGEHYIAHHVYVDLTVLSFIFLGFVLLSSSGAVR